MAIERDWRDFKGLYGNISGARDAFEVACEGLFRKVYNNRNVKIVRVNQGDGGIDVLIGELGVEPIIVVQCKFFLEEFGSSQQAQIRDSFMAAITSTNYLVEKWVLCTPWLMSIDENTWWCKWKNKMLKAYGKNEGFIELKNGNELIDLMKDHGEYNRVFKIEDSNNIEAILGYVKDLSESLTPKISIKNNGLVDVESVLFVNYTRECEGYYVERGVDQEFKRHIALNNVWVYGVSGCGKTAFVNRNMIVNGFEYLYCDFSPVTINSIDDFFAEIIDVVLQRCGRALPVIGNKIKYVCSLIEACRFNNGVVIVIDELSFKSSLSEEDLAGSIVRLVSYYNKLCGRSGLKFVISTIPEPRKIIIDKGKASESFYFLSLSDWREEIEKLFDMISVRLNMTLSDDDRRFIISEVGYSPRLLKVVLRRILGVAELNSDAIRYVVNKAMSEVV